MGLINTLGSYVYQTSYDDLPEAVIRSTKERILDFLGGAFSGYARGVHKPILKVFELYGGNKESTVIGEGVKVPCSVAAIVNYIMGIEPSDGSRFAALHPGAIVIPAALAVAEAKGRTRAISGRELILAIVLGYEVMVRVGQVMNPSAVKRGFYLTGIVGPIGSAAAAGKIMNLDEVSMTNALSIAATLGSGLLGAHKAAQPAVEIQGAKACEAGIICTLLAQSGFKGYDMILEEGSIPAFNDEYHLDLVSRDLGKDYMIPKTYIKRYGGCRHLHAPIDAVLYLVNKHNISPGDIEQIKVKTYSVALQFEIEHPKTYHDAMFNMPFAIAAGLIYGDVFLDRFTDQNLRSRQIQELMSKVKVEHEPELDKEYPAKRGTIVEITTKGGQTFSHKLDIAKGEPEWPLSKSEIEDKFNYLASGISAESRQRIIALIDRLESMEEISELFTQLGAQ